MLRKRWLAGTLPAERFAAAIEDLEDPQIDRYPALSLMRRAYELRENLTVHDAAHIALAELLGCDLLTGDRRLARAPRTECRVRLSPSA